MVKITEEHGGISSISINDEELQSDDGEIWHLPKGLVGDTSVEEIQYVGYGRGSMNIMATICSWLIDINLEE